MTKRAESCSWPTGPLGYVASTVDVEGEAEAAAAAAAAAERWYMFLYSGGATALRVVKRSCAGLLQMPLELVYQCCIHRWGSPVAVERREVVEPDVRDEQFVASVVVFVCYSSLPQERYHRAKISDTGIKTFSMLSTSTSRDSTVR